MTDDRPGVESSHRQTLRSSAIIGGASAAYVVIAIARNKAVALLVGPAGLGLIGLLQNTITVAAALASLGIGNVGTRQLAEAAGTGDEARLALARKSLFWGGFLLSAFAAVGLLLLRKPIEAVMLSGTSGPVSAVWLALGVALTVAATAQNAFLVGLRRIGDVARVTIVSAILSTAAGLGALLAWSEDGLLAFVIASPATAFAVGAFFALKTPRPARVAIPLSSVLGQWRSMLRLGAALSLGSLIVSGGQLLVRMLIQRDLGEFELGQFQAAWMLSMTYIGFILQAMGTDYYPRLAAVIADSSAANRLVNAQTEVALLLAGPVLIGVLGMAPWIIQLLYSSEFAGAAAVLRWQVAGDLVKILAWPMGFILLASGDGRGFLLSEAAATIAFVALTALTLPILGVQAGGFAFLGMYVAYLPLIRLLARRKTGFSWEPHVLKAVMRLVGAGVIVLGASALVPLLGAAISLVLSVALGLFALSALKHSLPARLRPAAELAHRAVARVSGNGT